MICLEFDNEGWGANGPIILASVLDHICKFKVNFKIAKNASLPVKNRERKEKKKEKIRWNDFKKP